jgi:hypothetical protein
MSGRSAVYRTYVDNFLKVCADFGRFLYMCARARTRKAKRIVEFGTSFGIFEWIFCLGRANMRHQC